MLELTAKDRSGCSIMYHEGGDGEGVLKEELTEVGVEHCVVPTKGRSRALCRADKR